MSLAMNQAINLMTSRSINPSIFYKFLDHFQMPPKILHILIKSLLKKDTFLTHVDIAKKLKRDKAIVSGYLDAMVDYGDICVRKVGNSKAYFLNNMRRN